MSKTYYEVLEDAFNLNNVNQRFLLRALCNHICEQNEELENELSKCKAQIKTARKLNKNEAVDNILNKENI